MNRLMVGSRSKNGFNNRSAGTHGLENARVMVRCDEGSVMVDVYALHGDIHIDLWLSRDSRDRPVKTCFIAVSSPGCLNAMAFIGSRNY